MPAIINIFYSFYKTPGTPHLQLYRKNNSKIEYLLCKDLQSAFPFKIWLILGEIKYNNLKLKDLILLD